MSPSHYIPSTAQTRWFNLNIEPSAEKIILEQLFNIPVDSKIKWKADITLGEIIKESGGNPEKILCKLNLAVKLLNEIVHTENLPTDTLNYYMTRPISSCRAVSEKWQYHESLTRLGNVSAVVFCDEDRAWNLSAALTIRMNTPLNSYVWPVKS